jgi:two-component system, chemotaxis family, chemotaxis protein CheY
MIILRNSHILIVDNSEAARGIVRRLLMQLGYTNIDEASNGADALAKLFERTYDLVISDWDLGAYDARALLKQIREKKEYTNLPFIAMTAEPAINKIVQAKHAGVTGFINKPFGAEAIQAKIAEINAE